MRRAYGRILTLNSNDIIRCYIIKVVLHLARGRINWSGRSNFGCSYRCCDNHSASVIMFCVRARHNLLLHLYSRVRKIGFFFSIQISYLINLNIIILL